MTTTNEQKRQAWLQAGKLAEQALALLVAVNEGPVEQAHLGHLAEKAEVQARLWTEPKQV